MKIDLILVCEDPTYGVRGHRKFWAARYETSYSATPTVRTRWGRIPPGREITIANVWAQQRKDVEFSTEEKAVAFIDKKAVEKSEKGYRVTVHEIDGVNLAQLHWSAADERGVIKMQTYGR